MDLSSFVTVLHPCGDPLRAEPAVRLLRQEKAGAIVCFGDVTGPVFSDAERILYSQALTLFSDTSTFQEKVRIAKAFLAGPGLGDTYREALRFYLTQVVDLAADDQIVWKEAYARTVTRLKEFAAGLSPHRFAAVADTIACEDAFEGTLLDFHSLEVGGLTLKGLGLAPAEQVLVPVKYTPQEFRQELGCAVPLGEYLAAFDILVANAFPGPVQERLRKAQRRLVILPGAQPEVSAFEGVTLVFDAPQTVSLFAREGAGLVRKVFRPVGAELRLTRIDTFDAALKLARSETGLDRLPLVPAVAKAVEGEGAPAAAPSAPVVAPKTRRRARLLLMWPNQDHFVDVMRLRYGADDNEGAILVVGNGQEAMLQREFLSPDVVVTWNPGGPESEFVSFLNERDPDRPVRIVSVWPAGTDPKGAGANALVEPYEIGELFARVDARLAQKAPSFTGSGA